MKVAICGVSFVVLAESVYNSYDKRSDPEAMRRMVVPSGLSPMLAVIVPVVPLLHMAVIVVLPSQSVTFGDPWLPVADILVPNASDASLIVQKPWTVALTDRLDVAEAVAADAEDDIASRPAETALAIRVVALSCFFEIRI